MGMKIPVGGNQEKEKARADQTQAINKEEEFDTNMVSHASLTWQDIISLYREKGWGEVLPIPANAKLKPPSGYTGNVRASTAEEIDQLWSNVPDNSNLAVRLPEGVLAVDIDQAEGKDGMVTLRALEEELGELPKGPYTSRKGPDSDYVHRYYRVEPGYKWADFGIGIDQRHHTLSYCMAWPSRIDDTQYCWYDKDGRKLSTPPHVDDLPELPRGWQDKFCNKDQRNQDAVGKSAQIDIMLSEVEPYLRGVTYNYDAPVPDSVRKQLDGFIERMDDDAHKSITEGQRWALRLCVFDGLYPGLGSILNELKDKFFEVRDYRPRGDDTIKGEWNRALMGELNKIRGAIERGEQTPAVARCSDVSPVDMSSVFGAEKAQDSFQEFVEAVRYICSVHAGDLRTAHLLAFGIDSIIAVDHPKLDGSSDIRIYDTESGRYISEGELMTSSGEITRVLKILRDDYKAQAEACEDEKEKARLMVLESKYNSEASKFSRSRDMTAALKPLKSVLVNDGRVKDSSDFDADPNTLLLKDGLVLDLKRALAGRPLADCVRHRTRDDLFSGNFKMGLAGSDIRRFAGQTDKHTLNAELFELAFPDPEVRKQVYKAQAYSMHGHNTKRIMWGMIGKTSLGKGSVTDALVGVLGSYATAISMADLRRSGGNNSALAKAARARFVVMSELSTKSEGDVSTLKTMSGNDMVDVTDKYLKSQTVRVGCKLCFETNHTPSLPGADEAFRKRLVVVPMEGSQQSIREWRAGQGDDACLTPAELVTHLELLMEHYPVAMSEGFGDDVIPQKMVDAADDFITNSDPLADFIEENFVFEHGAKLANNDLRDKFARVGNKYPELAAVTHRDLMESLCDRGARKTTGGEKVRDSQGKRGRGLVGVRLGSSEVSRVGLKADDGIATVTDISAHS